LGFWYPIIYLTMHSFHCDTNQLSLQKLTCNHCICKGSPLLISSLPSFVFAVTQAQLLEVFLVCCFSFLHHLRFAYWFGLLEVEDSSVVSSRSLCLLAATCLWLWLQLWIFLQLHHLNPQIANWICNFFRYPKCLWIEKNK